MSDTLRNLQLTSRRIVQRASGHYVRQRIAVVERRETRRETDDEVRRAIRQHDLGSAAFD